MIINNILIAKKNILYIIGLWACGGMVDTPVLGAGARAWEFKSLHAQFFRFQLILVCI